MKFKKGETVIYPQHGACIVQGTRKMEMFGTTQDYLILKTVINDMTLSVPVAKANEVGVRPPVSPDELEDLVAVLSKPDPRVPSNWSRRFKNHQEKLKSGDVYQVAEVVRNLAARNRDASLSAAERTMYDRARINLISEIAPALKVSTEEAERYLDDALARGVLKPPKAAKATAKAETPAPSPKPAAARPDAKASGSKAADGKKAAAAKTGAKPDSKKASATKASASKAGAGKPDAKTPAAKKAGATKPASAKSAAAKTPAKAVAKTAAKTPAKTAAKTPAKTPAKKRN